MMKPTLIAINKEAPSGKAELHLLSGNSEYKDFIYHKMSGIHALNENWCAAVADADHDYRGDLVAVCRAGNSGMTEIHVLSSASEYQSFIIQKETVLHATNQDWDFQVLDWDSDGYVDLVAINRIGGSGRTEIHVVSGKTDFKTYSLHCATALQHSGAEWSFHFARYSDPVLYDLIAINRQGGSGHTEIHVLSGRSSYQTFVLQVATGLHVTDANWRFGIVDWDASGAFDLAAINTNGASGYTEVHVLSQASRYQDFLLHAVTALHPVDSRWEIIMTPNDVDFRISSIASAIPSESEIVAQHIESLTALIDTSTLDLLGSVLDEYMRLNDDEKRFVIRHPIDSLRARDAQKEALSRSSREFSQKSLLNGEGDASRHCYWSSMMCRDLGDARAAEILDNHESGRNDPHDRHNNSVGREICRENPGGDNDTMWGECRKASGEGKLSFDRG